MGTTVCPPRRLLPLLVSLFAVAVLAASCGGSPALATHLSSGCRDGGRIALTFDDGPNPAYTGQILDELVNAGARATFFVEGQAVEADPATVRREIAAGMAVGAHSYAHSKELPDMSQRDFAADLRRTGDAIAAAAGLRPALFRAPYGHTSDTMLRALQEARYTSIGWDIDSEDWSDASADEIVANVLDRAHPGAIVLMHDGGLGGGHADRAATLAALPRIIEGLRAHGYTLVTVPELTGGAASHDAAQPREATCSAN